MAKRKTYEGPTHALERYDAVIATIDGLTRKGAASAYTSLNGWMTSFLDGEGSMCLRLGRDDRTEFLDRYDTAIARQYGKNMPEFVVVPDDLLGDLDELGPWFRRSYDWVATLTPKPTRSRKATKRR